MPTDGSCFFHCVTAFSGVAQAILRADAGCLTGWADEGHIGKLAVAHGLRFIVWPVELCRFHLGIQTESRRRVGPGWGRALHLLYYTQGGLGLHFDLLATDAE